jgi:hypothetical protein
MNRKCTWCGHPELQHWGRECTASRMFDGPCGCDGFCARELEEWELEIMDAEEGKRRGQIGDHAVADEYSEIREHLAKVMEQASK